LDRTGLFASRDLSTELSEPLEETIAAGARPTFFFISEKCCGNVREQEGECSVPAQFQNSPSVISELNVVDAAKTSEGREGSVT
jgi:hypothetical protein